MRPREHHNPKKRIAPIPTEEAQKNLLAKVAKRVRYVGNPDHKRNPGDYRLTPPSRPRPGKSLCDVAKIFTRAEAQELLEKGIRDGLVSEQQSGGWPRLVWAIKGDTVLEARLDNVERGTYHGYPLDPTDPFCTLVHERWLS